MATMDEVWTAVHGLVARVDHLDPDVRGRYAVERTLSCRLTDLDTVLQGRIGEDGLRDVHTEVAEKAQVRLTCTSDDFLALVEGRLAVAAALATGRLRLQAGPLDLLKLRQLI